MYFSKMAMFVALMLGSVQLFAQEFKVGEHSNIKEIVVLRLNVVYEYNQSTSCTIRYAELETNRNYSGREKSITTTLENDLELCLKLKPGGHTVGFDSAGTILGIAEFQTEAPCQASSPFCSR